MNESRKLSALSVAVHHRMAVRADNREVIKEHTLFDVERGQRPQVMYVRESTPDVAVLAFKVEAAARDFAVERALMHGCIDLGTPKTALA